MMGFQYEENPGSNTFGMLNNSFKSVGMVKLVFPYIAHYDKENMSQDNTSPVPV